MTSRPWSVTEDGLRVSVRVRPGASAERVDGIARLADGAAVVKVRVNAPAEGGKANAALAKLLAKRWRLAKSDIEIVAGHTSRDKILRLRGGGDALAERLAADLE